MSIIHANPLLSSPTQYTESFYLLSLFNLHNFPKKKKKHLSSYSGRRVSYTLKNQPFLHCPLIHLKINLFIIIFL